MEKRRNAKSIIAGTIFLTITLFIIMIIRPVPKATLENCEKVTGQVEEIREGDGEADIVIDIKGDKNYYYVNRGLERGLDLEVLQEKLTEQDVALYYVKHRSILDPNNSTRHIARIEWMGTDIYNEMSH